jgi:hypothetical protein
MPHKPTLTLKDVDDEDMSIYCGKLNLHSEDAAPQSVSVSEESESSHNMDPHPSPPAPLRKVPQRLTSEESDGSKKTLEHALETLSLDYQPLNPNPVRRPPPTLKQIENAVRKLEAMLLDEFEDWEIQMLDAFSKPAGIGEAAKVVIQAALKESQGLPKGNSNSGVNIAAPLAALIALSPQLVGSPRQSVRLAFDQLIQRELGLTLNVDANIKTTYTALLTIATPERLREIFSSWANAVRANDHSNTTFLQCLSGKVKGSVKGCV